MDNIIHNIQLLENKHRQKIISILDALDIVAPIFPVPMYWHDTKGVVLGANVHCLNGMNRTAEEVLGKTPYDFYSKEIADHIWKHSEQVIKSGETLSQEERVYDSSGNYIGTYLSIKTPLYDDSENIIGILGTSVDITDRKEAEKFKLETQARIYQTRIEEQEQFREIAAQVAHDLGSPLASLKMIIPHCTTLPESTRSALSKAATRISDIAENFLSQFRPKHDDNLTETQRIPTLIMAEILEILTEKKYQYSKLSIDFTTSISQSGAFAFINIDIVSFKRMLSNLINNAVDALDGWIGEVTIGLDEIDNQVLITVTDNGKGIPEDVKNKILTNVEVTSGKVEGHGIGFVQIRETLHNNEGKFDIESQLGAGTRVKLYFPKVVTPDWMAKSIELNNDDQIIILDDDDSIHTAWELRFEKAAPHIKRYHFKQGNEAIEFINSLPVESRNKIFLLTDYELLRQGLHGLDVIEKTGIKRSILVTSHHNNQLVRDKARLTNTKILPKLLASEVIINYH